MAKGTSRVAVAIVALGLLAAGGFGLSVHQRSVTHAGQTAARRSEDARREREASRARLRAMVGELSGKLSAMPTPRPPEPVVPARPRHVGTRGPEVVRRPDPAPEPTKPPAKPVISDDPLEGVGASDDITRPERKSRKAPKKTARDYPLDGLTL